VIELLAAAILAAAAVLGVLIRRWWVLLPLPGLLALYAWSQWEWSGLASLYVAAIAVLGYGGLAAGLLLRRAIRGR
jgi:hypothetical protein